MGIRTSLRAGRVRALGYNVPDPETIIWKAGITMPEPHESNAPRKREKTSVMPPVAPAHRGRAVSRPPRRGRGPLIALGACSAALALVYGAGVVLFGNVCYPNTVIADVDVSLMARDTAVSRVRTSAEGYRLEVTAEDFSWMYDPESASEVIDADGAVARVIESNDPVAWPVRLFNSMFQAESPEGEAPGESERDEASLDTIELPKGFDREAFLADLGAAVDAFNSGRTGTFDAAGAYDEKAGAFTIERARSNQRLDKEAVERAALMAVSRLDGKVDLGADCMEPLANGATDDELKAAVDRANELIGSGIDIKMGGAVVATLDGSSFAQWMTFDENLVPTLSTEPLAQWVHELALAKLDTIGSQRTYTRPDGKTVTVSGGTYGWNSNEAELVKALQGAISNGGVGEVVVPTLQSAAVWTAKGERDWGAYCDIDLSEQRCRYYDASGSLVWESGCVTGNPNKGWSTPTGVYMLNAKAPNQVLLGTDDNHDGEPDYRSPVDYWLPFVGNMVGLHDANWQPAANFSNPQAYTWAGSRGCVNLPTDKAGELFNIINVGDCVIVHD